MEEQSQAQQQTEAREPDLQESQPSKDPVKPTTPDDHYWRRQSEKAEKRIKDLERASMSELERLRAERDELARERDNYKSEIADQKKRNAFVSKAKSVGVIDEEVAYLLAKSALELTDDGDLIGADKFLTDLRKSRPHLFVNGGKLGSGGGNTKSARAAGANEVNQKMNAFMRG